MKRILISILAMVLSFSAIAQTQIKVACIGDSITYGLTIEDRENNSYPSVLQSLLGSDYLVGNFGKSGATLLYKGHRPYVQQEEYKQAIDFKADIAVIHLGINDTDPRDWPPYGDEFLNDNQKLITSLRETNQDMRIIIARMTPIVHNHPRFNSGTKQWHALIQKEIEQVAVNMGVELIDFHEPLYKFPNLIPDNVHPNKEGAKILANVVYSQISGNYGGLQMPMLYADNMIIQRERPVVISGIANSGDKVKVNFAGQKAQTEVGLDGKWTVTLKPVKVGTDYTLKIATADRELVYKNVAVGDVWLCSGQSNMEWTLVKSNGAKAAIEAATNKNIRFYDMKSRYVTYDVAWKQEQLDTVNNLDYYIPTTWTECTPEAARDFSAIGYFFGQKLQEELDVPIGLICNAVGGSNTESWIDRSTLEWEFPLILRDYRYNDFIQDWARNRAASNQENGKGYNRHPYEPAYLYECGILPLEHFAIKGAIWYQGESNAHNMEAHEELFTLMVESWRDYWNDDTLPIHTVQLSSMARPSWPRFRDSQRRLAEEIPNVTVTVCHDKGDSLDVHPRDKKPVGERLARQALYNTYGRTDVVPSGPVVKKVSVEGKQICIEFDFGKGLKTYNDKPVFGFEVAGADKVFHHVSAEIKGDRIYLPLEKGFTPEYLRYAWQPYTRANLVNAE